MSLITQICVMFLAWMLIGATSLIGYLVYIFTKVMLLDIERTELPKEVLNLAWGSYKNADPDKTDTDESSGKEAFASLLRLSLKWPASLAVAVKDLSAAYEQIKDEYDRGIRTKKEPS